VLAASIIGALILYNATSHKTANFMRVIISDNQNIQELQTFNSSKKTDSKRYQRLKLKVNEENRRRWTDKDGMAWSHTQRPNSLKRE
jgi:hypothetical protein